MWRLQALIHPIQLTQNHQVPFTCCPLSKCCALVHAVPLAWHLPFPPSPAINLENCILSDPAQVLPFCHADSDFYFLKATCLFPYELHACVCVRSLQSCLALCNPVYYSLPSSSVHGILQARILEWVAVPSSRDLPDPGIEPTSLMSPSLTVRFFTSSTTWEAPCELHTCITIQLESREGKIIQLQYTSLIGYFQYFPSVSFLYLFNMFLHISPCTYFYFLFICPCTHIL